MITEEQKEQRCEEILLSEVGKFVKETLVTGDYFYEPDYNNLFIFLALPKKGWIRVVKYKFITENMDFEMKDVLMGPPEILNDLIK